MNTLLRLAAAIAVLLLATTGSQARPHYKHHRYQHYDYTTTYSAVGSYQSDEWNRYRVAYASYERQTQSYQAQIGTVVSHPSGCPGHAFCGCGVCVKLGISAATCKRMGLFLASAWGRFQSASAGPGMVAYRNHHVMYIESVDGGGNATVYDPNSGGHATRVHAVSLRGYRIVNPHGGSRMAGI